MESTINRGIGDILLNQAKIAQHTYDEYQTVSIGAFTSSAYYNRTTGAVTAASGNYKYAQPYNVTPGEIYRISGTVSYAANLYIIVNAANAILEVYPDTNAADKVYNNHDFIIPTTGAKLLINSVDSSTVLEKYIATKQRPPKIGIVGDSLSDPSTGHVVNMYFDFLENIDGYIINNVAVGGSGYRKRYDTTQAFYQKALILDADCDVVLVSGSFNDKVLLTADEEAYPIGAISDTVETASISGAINKTIANIRTTCPNAQMLLVTPTPWYDYTPKDAVDTLQIRYINAIINIGAYQGVTVLDLFRQSNLQPWDAACARNYYYKGDTVHLNGLGHEKRLYPAIKAGIKSLI